MFGFAIGYLKTNWKTTAAGLGAIITIALKYWATGELSYEDVAGLFIGSGLVAAKDANVTGGTVRNSF